MSHKKHIVNLCILALMIVCVGLSIGYGNKAKVDKQVANIYMDNTSVTADTISNMHELEKKEDIQLSFTSWKQIDNATVEYLDLNKRATVDVIKVCGDSSLVINGPILFWDNKEGCLIDKETAYALFGSEKVVGEVINYEDRELEIVGIHKGMHNTVVMQTDNNSTESMDAVAVEVSDTVSRSIKAFTDRYGITGEGIDNRVYYNMSNIFIMILPFIIFMILIVTFIREILKVKRKPILCLIYIIITIVFFAIFIKILGIEIKIPYDIIPNKWSDFGYWGDLFDTYKNKFETVMYMKKYNMDIILIESTVRSVTFSILSIILFFNFKKRVEIKNIKELTILISGMLIISFIVILGLQFKYNLEITGLTIWLLIPYYYIGRYIINSNKLNIFDSKEVDNKLES